MNFGALAPLAILIVLCAVAAWLDLTQRRIPNWLCGLTVIAGLTVAAVLGGLSGLGSHALHMVIALLGGIALFAIGAFGGGDAKFYAGVASWFGLSQGPLLLIYVTLSGLLLLIAWFTYRRIRRIPMRRRSAAPGEDLPYGLAIGAGAILTAWL